MRQASRPYVLSRVADQDIEGRSRRTQQSDRGRTSGSSAAAPEAYHAETDDLRAKRLESIAESLGQLLRLLPRPAEPVGRDVEPDRSAPSWHASPSEDLSGVDRPSSDHQRLARGPAPGPADHDTGAHSRRTSGSPRPLRPPVERDRGVVGNVRKPAAAATTPTIKTEREPARPMAGAPDVRWPKSTGPSAEKPPAAANVTHLNPGPSRLPARAAPPSAQTEMGLLREEVRALHERLDQIGDLVAMLVAASAASAEVASDREDESQNDFPTREWLRSRGRLP